LHLRDGDSANGDARGRATSLDVFEAAAEAIINAVNRIQRQSASAAEK
ncbi:MAG: hypothetical protein HUK22_01505, partial [Thermoguttaceae bacterium]|nr:hypothetical protein [Thermoguttaceae bacterium]